MRDKFGNTPLHGSVRNEHYRVMVALAENDKPSLRGINDVGESPLSIAIDMRLTSYAAKIIRLHPETLDDIGQNGQTPLHVAVKRNDFEIVSLILKYKPKLVIVQDERERTPLHYAAALGHQRMVEELFKEDPMVAYIKDDKKKIPLLLAAENGQVSLVNALLDSCWDTVEILDEHQRNILHLAAMNGNVDVVKYILTLVEMEDLVNSPDVDGDTPLHLAATNYHSEVVTVLSKKSNVEIRAMNNSNRTALAIVKYSTHNRGMELQKHLTLKALKSAYKQKFINPEDVLENPRLDDMKVEIPVEYGEKGRQMAQMIAMMSTLLATFTFTAAFTIPGGFKNDNPDAGMAMLISKAAFKAFVISDSIAMTSSITAAVIVFWSSSLRDTESFMDTLPFAIGLTWISLIAMAVAFVTGLFVVLQKTLWLAILVCAIGCAAPFFLYIFAPACLLVYERISKSRTSLCERQNMVEDNPFLFIVRLMKIFVRRQSQSLYRHIGLMCQSLCCRRRDLPRSACLALRV
ncbi:hypothetical protein like AT4G03500 [Hibiscus trionum]|uniref:PGG domain-containing protein n=1 Tax=Hibiscus trionum TaxID=183268 RepID=A0A9W7MMB0_HIBTR|nr:hypothetical protein like AT4G03500 [Hibiscus trionum]